MSSTPPAPPPPPSPECVLGVGPVECRPKPEPSTTQQICFTADEIKRVGALLEKRGDDELAALLSQKLSFVPDAGACASEIGADGDAAERMSAAEDRERRRQYCEDRGREPCLTLDG